MIKQAAYGTEPWRLVEKELDLDLLAQSESIFALSNGHIGMRGNLDEGEPHGLPGTYLNSLFELRPLPYAEAGYGYPDTGQSVINVTNGKIIRLLVDDEPLTPFTRAVMAGDVTSSLTHWGTEGLQFINADYTITLSRMPEGIYIGLASVTHYSHAGVATGVATLFDQTGPIGSGMATALANPGFRPPASITPT